MLGALLLVQLFWAVPREPALAVQRPSAQAAPALPRLLKITFTGLVQLIRRSDYEVQVIIPDFEKYYHRAYAAFPEEQLLGAPGWDLQERCDEDPKPELNRYVRLGPGEILTVHPRSFTQGHQQTVQVDKAVADLAKLAHGAPLKEDYEAQIPDYLAATMVLRAGPLHPHLGEKPQMWEFCKEGRKDCDPPRCLARGVVVIFEFDSKETGVVLRSNKKRQVDLKFDNLNQADLEIGNITVKDLKCPKTTTPEPDRHFLHHYETLQTPYGFEGKYPFPTGGTCKQPPIFHTTARGHNREIAFATFDRDRKKAADKGPIVIRSAVGENCPPGSGGP